MKSFLVLIILIFLTACTSARYDYYPENYKSDALNKGAQTKEIFSGTVEDYKKQKK